MTYELTLGDLTIQVHQKNIKNIHLRVYPPDGKISLSVPNSLSSTKLQAFVISKQDWIQRQRKKIQAQVRIPPKTYSTGESHYFRGECYRLEIIEHHYPPKVERENQLIRLYVRPNTSTEQRAAILEHWYRTQLKLHIPKLIAQYDQQMAVCVKEFRVKKMKTRWGTCNPKAQRIWLNLELIKKSPELLEYVVVHEMVHLLEPSHNQRFQSLMTTFLPNWAMMKDKLNGSAGD